MFSKNFSRNNKTDRSPKVPVSPEASAFFEDILNRGLSLRLRATGRSMAPFLRGGEIVTIKKVPCASLRIGDLIFYKGWDTPPLLHRIVKKQRTENGLVFQTKGDAVSGADEPVSEHDILGKVCIIEKNFFGMGTKHVHMGSRFWKTINYLLAIISSFRSRMYLAVSR